MRITIALAALLMPSIALAADPKQPAQAEPLPAAQAAATMQVPEGFKVTVVAAEPDIVQPIGFAIDDRGRFFIAEAFNYGAWKAEGNDRITILEDTNGDGRADSRKVFYEGLNYVTGIEVGFGGVWVMSPPCLYFIPDRDGDDKPDSEPIVLFDGIGYKESRHNLANGFTWGPDGWLYFGHGRTSPSDVGRPGTSADQRVHCDGGVARIHPTRLVFENFADGTTNPWGVAFDDYGQCFVSNCVNPHLFHMIQGGHYEPWRNRPSSKYAYDRLPTIADHLHYPGGKWQASRGGTPETLAMGGGHAHCGTLIYLGDSFPKQYRNSALMCNVHGHRINNDILQRKGSGYIATHGKDIMISKDQWFMGVTLKTGPDGSVYVTDWSDTGECHTYKPHKENGRMYRLSYGDAKGKAPNLAALTDMQLVELQLHRNEYFVEHARRRLQERSAEEDWSAELVHTPLWKMLKENDDVTRRLRALWALHATGGTSEASLAALLDDGAEHVRAWAIQLLGEKGRPSDEVLATWAAMAESDTSPVVRLYLASALQRLPANDRWPIISALITHEQDKDDANLPLMYWYALEPLVAQDRPRALALAGKTRIPLIRQFIARRSAEK